ncbi:MAG: hypothetical protein J0L55_02920 [Caulobacterales bacterium]|nr:hypothetical protein [Caulobacterales bacterium]MCA0371620.1 hypothetical protein [Pseudomonadota bacterium]
MRKLIFALCATFFLSSCDAIKFKDSTKEEVAPAQNSQQGEKVVANFDVDKAETEKFKQELVTAFPAGSNGADVEKALSSKGYDCGPDPTKTDERACTNAITKDECVIMSIVRTLPYAPDGAQIIKACGMVN